MTSKVVGHVAQLAMPGMLAGVASLGGSPTLVIIGSAVLAVRVLLDSRAVEILLHGFNLRRTYKLVAVSPHKLSDNATDVIRHANPDSRPAAPAQLAKDDGAGPASSS